MKAQLLALTLAIGAALPAISFAEATPPQTSANEELTQLPTDEKAFVDAISKFDKQKIVAQFGEPAKADDVKIKGTNKVIASIWHYHNINKAEDGQYYQTTELDFIDDKVVQVVFLNNDGSETEVQGQTYEIDPGKAGEQPPAPMEQLN